MCGASAMSCESSSGISLGERSPTLGSDVTTPWPWSWLHCRLFAACRAQGDSGASLIGHGGMCTAEGASLEAAPYAAGPRSGSAKLMVQKPLGTLAATENPIRLWTAMIYVKRLHQ